MYFKKFSLITVCYDRWYHLQHVIRSWFEQDYPKLEFVVVAGGTDDGPLQLVQIEEFHGMVLRIRNAPNYRASYMRNAGAMAAQGEVLGFVDADIVLDKQWVSYCMMQLQRRYDIVANEGTLNDQDSGGCSGTQALQRWLFEKIHGFNENLDYSWGYEDTDLLVRAQRAGGRPMGYPPSMVRHIKHGDDVRQKHFIGQWEPRAPRTFMQQLDVCRRDTEIHLYEANRVQRLSFPPDEITKIAK